VHSVYLTVAYFCHELSALFKVTQSFNFSHQVLEFGVFIDLQSVFDYRSNHVWSRALEDCDIEDGVSVVGQGYR